MVLSSRHLLFLLASLSLILASTLPALAESSHAPPRAKLMLISWDGAGDVLMDRLLAENKLPNLSKLAARGARAEHMIGTWPTKTAPSHASIYTGCGPGVHGITANSVPPPGDRSQHTVLESIGGFSSSVLKAEPLFVTTVLEGLDTVVLGASHYHPTKPIAEMMQSRQGNLPVGTFRSLNGFEHRLLPSGTLADHDLGPASDAWTDLPPMAENAREPLEMELRAGEQTVYGLVFDHRDDPVEGFDSVLLRLAGRAGDAPAQTIMKPHEASPKPVGWSPPFTVIDGPLSGRLYFRLFELSPDGSKMVLYRREITAPVGDISESDFRDFMAAGLGSYDDGSRAYGRGRLGRPLMLGGDGTAEERLVETVAFDVEGLIANTAFAWKTWQPDVFFHYAPYLDHVGHTWLGVLHPDSATYNPEIADRVWFYYARIAGQLDRWLGAMMELAGDDTLVALVSDHGMAYSTHDVAVNRILEDAGLLTRGDDGRIDLARTKILAADASFYLRVNGTQWRQGVVPPEQYDGVVEQAAAALLAVRDPETGRAVIPKVFPATELSHLGLHTYGGDLYLDTAPGYYPVPFFPETQVRRSRRPWGGGTHGHWRQRRDMHAIFYVAGPGVANVDLPPMSQIDVAPTLAELMGIRPPANACGRVLYEALAEPAQADP